MDAGTPGRRDAGTPGRRDAGTPGRRDAGRLEAGGSRLARALSSG